MNNSYDEIVAPLRVKDEESVGDIHGWIQFKGTDICIDIHCKCGNTVHYDGYFAYLCTCPHCKQTYVLGSHIKLYPVTEEQASELSKNWMAPKICEI